MLDFRDSPKYPEIIGLASGAKRTAFFEIRSRDEMDIVFAGLRAYSRDKFEMTLLPKITWINNFNEEYKYTTIVGRSIVDVIRYRSILSTTPDTKERHALIGKYLSYPLCCCDSRYNGNTICLKKAKINMIDYRLNNFFNKTGCGLFVIRHHLCSYQCEESIAYSDKVLRFLRIVDSFMYNKLLDNMKMPLLITDPGKTPFTFLAFDGRIEDSVLYYKNVSLYGADITGTGIKTLYSKFRSCNSIRINDSRLVFSDRTEIDNNFYIVNPE